MERNGYEILRNKVLKSLKKVVLGYFDTDIRDGIKINVDLWVCRWYYTPILQINRGDKENEYVDYIDIDW